MKNWIWLFLAFVAAVFIFYLFIPAEYTFNESAHVEVTENEANRLLPKESTWNEISNTTRVGNNPTDTGIGFMTDGAKFRFQGASYGTFSFNVNINETNVPGILQVIPKADSSIWLNFKISYSTGTSPVNRVRNYFKARELGSSSQKFLDATTQYLERVEEGSRKQIVRSTVMDTNFLSLQFVTEGYPATEEIYKRIDSLTKYIGAQGAKINGAPMLHVRPMDSLRYLSMVALPVNTPVETAGKFSRKKMIRGNILVYEFKGGSNSTREAFSKVEQYVQDHRLKSPAIPYVSLITNRTAEPDSSKWVSRIYYPIY